MHHKKSLVQYFELRQEGQEIQDGLQLNTTHQLLVYAGNANLLGENINSRKKNTESLLVTCEVVGQKINIQETKYLFMSCEQKAGQN